MKFRRKSSDVWKEFLDITTKSATCKRKNDELDKLDFIKIKNFCSVNGTVQRVKRQDKSWENIYLRKTYPTEDIYPKCIGTFKTQ